ncbi:EF-hand [Anaeromyces robustus]|uniref:EF-hand n=1 Tax=Anaeromyces robustus TaxID=1754192 RepID=A0A1Y1XL95_9FUNG|nr:EF-hand [Anaeromyces robustus]|eukprot:ORX86463.1 EF-hand [Anaeromyces robustus]
MSEVLSENQIKKFEEVYKFYDKDSNGEIDSTIFCNVVRSLGYVPKDSDVEEIKNKYNNKLHLEDFIVFMGRKINNIESEEDAIKEALSLFEDGNGDLNEKEFVHCMKTLGKYLKPNDIDEFLNEFEKKNKKISINDFKDKLMAQ